METKLELPYKKHLAFTGSDQFKLNSTHNFDKHYVDLKSGQYSKPTECLESIRKIFAELQPQASNERESLFIADFEKQTLRLLNEDIATFLKGKIEPTATTSDVLEKFTEQRFLQNQLSEQVVNKINSHISNIVKEFHLRAKEGKTKREDLSINIGPVVRAVKALLNREFERQGVLPMLKQYMGLEMCVTGLAIELSVPSANWWKVAYPVYERTPKTLYYHFDESIAYPKAIVYLNDVTEKNGATSCSPKFVRKSELTELQFLLGRSIGLVGRDGNPKLKAYYNHQYHQAMGCPEFRKDFSKLPDALKFSSHFGWDVIPDSDMEKFLLQDEHKITGKAGTYIAFDGGLLPHRGGMIQEGHRVALQVVFGEKLPLYKKVINKLKQLF